MQRTKRAVSACAAARRLFATAAPAPVGASASARPPPSSSSSSSAVAAALASLSGAPPAHALSVRSGDARWVTQIRLPGGAEPSPTKPRLPPHQTVFRGYGSAKVGGPVPEGAAASAEPAAGSSAWTSASRRCGVLAIKAGMTADWDQWGIRRALTVLKLEDVIVTGVATEEERGYTALQVGAGLPRPKELTRAVTGQFRRYGVAPRSHVAEFRVTPDALLEPGTPLLAQHFVPGQALKITGTSQGKGFQGAMKLHGFAGQGASHGNSLSHRVLGATGNRQDPGKVIKGKKMPGRMGGDTITMDGPRVYKVDVRHNLLYVEGALPGKPGTLLRVSDSLKRAFADPPPFPTYSLTDEDRKNLALWAAGAFASPMEEAALEAEGLLGDCLRQPPYEYVRVPPEVDPFAIPENDEPEAA